jgi:hypothetical protein
VYSATDDSLRGLCTHHSAKLACTTSENGRDDLNGNRRFPRSESCPTVYVCRLGGRSRPWEPS